MGLFEFALFFVGTSIVSWGAYLFGKVIGWEAGATWRSKCEPLRRRAEGFDDKVDIVCNACGLVAEVECAACPPIKVVDVKCGTCNSLGVYWDDGVRYGCTVCKDE